LTIIWKLLGSLIPFINEACGIADYSHVHDDYGFFIPLIRLLNETSGIAGVGNGISRLVIIIYCPTPEAQHMDSLLSLEA